MTRVFGAVLTLAALIVLGFGFSSGSADANGRVRTSCGIVVGGHAPTIHHTPIHHSHHHGGHHVEKIVVAVPFAVPSIAFQYLPAVQPPVAAPAPAISPADLDRMIDERIKAREGHKVGATAGGIPVAKPRGSATPTPPVGPGTSGGSPGTPASDVLGILTNRCASCHTGGSSKGSFRIFNEPGILAPLTRAQKSFISTAADTAFMPPSANGDINHPNAVPGEEVNRLKAWVLE